MKTPAPIPRPAYLERILPFEGKQLIKVLTGQRRVGYRPMDTGSILENAVYNQLAADGYDIKIGVLDKNREIDFVAEKDGERKYIQVAVHVNDPSTALREFGNLKANPDNYEKILVTLRDSAPNTLDGIRMLSLRQFLTQ